MAETPLYHFFGGENHLSRFWKVSVANTIWYVIVSREDVDGTLIGQVLYTKEQYFNAIPASDVVHQTEATFKFINHDEHHHSTRSEQLMQLILVDGLEISFFLSDKVADIAVFDYRCFAGKLNVFVHHFGQKSIYCIHFCCTSTDVTLRHIEYNDRKFVYKLLFLSLFISLLARMPNAS